jgi:hypothetical protein
MAEALLRDTDAIKRNTLEWYTYHGGYLVRYKNGSNMVNRVQTKSWDEANAAFEKFLKAMRASSKS